MTSNRELDPAAVDPVANRRRWIRLCGSVGLAGLAGGLGDDDDTGDTSTDNGDDDGPGGSETDEDDAAEQTGTDGEADEGSDGEADSAGERIELAPEDGWKESHDGVEVPDQPGTAILKIGGERIELGVFGTATESPDGMGTTGAEVFEASGAAQSTQSDGSGIQVEFQRLLGFQGSAGTWAESDSIAFTRGDGVRLGNVIFRQYEDGTLADAEQAGDLEGRTFVDGSFIHVTTEGVLTAVEELVSHEDDPLDGRFEFGARLQDGWDQ